MDNRVRELYDELLTASTGYIGWEFDANTKGDKLLAREFRAKREALLQVRKAMLMYWPELGKEED